MNLDPKIQIKHMDTENQLADILTKGNCTRDEWNHLFSLFNKSHFSSIKSVKVMSKRTEEGAGEQRVTAKSRLMTNLVSRCRATDPTVLASTASENPVNPQVRGHPLLLLAHQTLQNGAMTTNGLLKCGNLMKCPKRARGNLYLTIWSSILIWTLPPPQNRTFL